MTTSEKPTLHLEGLVLEAEVKQGGTPPKEFRKIKIGNLWLSCWTPELYPLMVKGKYLAVDYTITQRGTFTNYNIQEATEMVAPAPPATGPSEAPNKPLEAPSPWPQAQDARGASIEAQVAAYCTAQVLAALLPCRSGQWPGGTFISDTIDDFYQGMQEAKAGKHMGGAALSTGEQTKLLSPDSPAKPTTRPTIHPNSEASPGAAPPKPDIDQGTFWKGWAAAKLSQTNKGVEELISKATGGKALGVQMAQGEGWRLDDLLAKVLEVKERP